MTYKESDHLKVPMICHMCKGLKSGDGHPTFNRESLYWGPTNAYYWVDEFIPILWEIMGV